MGYILYHKNKIRQIKYQHKVWFFLQIFVLEGIISCMLYVISLFMKKVFIWLKTNILRHKKSLIYGALALFIGQICFFNLWWLGVNNSVYAADTSTQNATFQESATRRLHDLSFLKKWCYILLYPILILAGALVNNSFVYAEVFSFDTVLWQLWNIVRNLANYALWFLFVYKIFNFLTTGQKSSDIGNLLRSTLIAWIWIQASWFLLAVLIDISNILTYSVGWLPIHILWTQSDSWENADFWNPYVFQTVISLDLDDPDSIYYYLSNTATGWAQWWNHFIAECETFSFKENEWWEELIVAPKIVYYYDWSGYYKTEMNKCHVWDDVFNLNEKELADGILWQNAPNPTWKDSQNKYRDSLDEAIKKLTQKTKDQLIWGEIAAWKVLQIKNAHLTWDGIWHTYEGATPWLDVDNKVVWEEWNMAKLHDILQWDDGYIWVFSALYSSLLNAWSDFKIQDVWIYSELLNTVLSFCHLLAVGIPLLAMLVVFFMRIGVIWMAIILSPIIILLRAFKFEDKVFKKGTILENLAVGNLIRVIFSPAVICFAVSISTVLVRIISTVNAEHVMDGDKTQIFGWLIQLELAWLWQGVWKLICSVIWVAISWFLIWSAVQASSLWKSKFVQSIKNFATSTLWALPIVPVPGKDGVSFVWVDAVKKIPSQIEQQVKSKYGEESNNAVLDIIDSTRVAWRRADAYKEEIKNFVPVAGTDWTAHEISIANWWYKQSFNNLPWDKKSEVIAAINGMEESKREVFGKNKPEIQFEWWDGKLITYVFNWNKYEEKK